MKIPPPILGDVLSYPEMCAVEHARLWRGMNFRLGGGLSVILMSRRVDALYADRVEDDGRTLIYEGHNAPLRVGSDPEVLDQPARTASGGLTQNGLFHAAAEEFKRGESEPELVKAYEKLSPGAWVYNGVFALVDAWQEDEGGRRVWKFRLEAVAEGAHVIAPHVKAAAWKRDAGRCARCGSDKYLRFEIVGDVADDEGDVQVVCTSCAAG